MHRHLRSTGLSELASDTLSETLPVQHLRSVRRLWHRAQYSARSSRSAFVRKKPRRHWQSQRSQTQALVLSQVFRLGNDHSGILRRLSWSGVLPCHFQRTQSRHYVPKRHIIILKNNIVIIFSNIYKSYRCCHSIAII